MEKQYFGSDQEGEQDDSLAPLKQSQIEEEVGNGSFSRVYDVKDSEGNFSDKVVKIGETREFSVSLLKILKLKLPRERVGALLKVVLGDKFDIMPTKEMIQSGVAEYLLMKEYFGGDEINEDDGEMNEISREQRRELLSVLQNEESDFYGKMRAIVGDTASIDRVRAVVQKYQNENFLPKEQTVIGHPPSLTRAEAQKLEAEGKDLPMTFYIFQDKVQGENVVHLSDLSDEVLSAHPAIIEKLMTFAVLTKKMYEDTGKLIDTRPAGILSMEWFQETENIMVDKDTGRVYFVDTRLLWDKDTKTVGSNGLNIIEKFGVKSIDQAIKKYADLLERI